MQNSLACSLTYPGHMIAGCKCFARCNHVEIRRDAEIPMLLTERVKPYNYSNLNRCKHGAISRAILRVPVPAGKYAISGQTISEASPGWGKDQ